jgi:hypothetical protein
MPIPIPSACCTLCFYLIPDRIEILLSRDSDPPAQIQQAMRDGFDDDLFAIKDKSNLISFGDPDLCSYFLWKDDLAAPPNSCG